MNFRSSVVLIAVMSSTLFAINKEPITVREGFPFTIKLPSAQIAGVDWFWGNQKELEHYVQLEKTEFIGSSSIVAGRIGKKIFTFNALNPGKIIIKLVKRKSWENKELDHTLIKVIIKKADLNTAPIQK